MITSRPTTLLFTWRDVRDRLEAPGCGTADPWAATEIDVFGLRAYTDDPAGARAALADRLGAAFDPDSDTVRLVGWGGGARTLPVELLPGVERPPSRRPIARPLWGSGLLEERPPVGEASCPIVAFFSFKGGVGRTASCFSTLLSLLDRDSSARVLYVDADVEAPGLTWMVGPDERLSWVDALALVHDSDDWRRDALALIAERTALSSVDLELGSGRKTFLFLPAVRSMAQVESLPVTPEQVVRRHDRSWVVGDLLAALAEKLELDAVLVDLRAGITEFSSPLMLDPRVRNVLVTSCSEQSVLGTQRALQQVEARTTWPAGTDIIVTQVPRHGDERFADINRRLDETWADSGDDPPAGAELPEPWTVHRVDFSDTLLVFDDLQGFAGRLPGTPLDPVSRSLAEALLPPRRPRRRTPRASAVAAEGITALAEQLEFAENNARLGLLPTPPLRHLATLPAGQLPAAVVLGSKGSGKTFTWGQLVVSETWAEFCKALNVEGGADDVDVFPLLFPTHLGDALRRRAREVEERNRVGDAQMMTSEELARALGSSQQVLDDELTFWTRAIARRLGLPPEAGTSPRSLEKALEGVGRRVVLIVDGIEDAMQTGPGKPMSDPQQRLLRGLLTDLVVQLRDLGPRYLGLVVFIRRDLARAAIPQNFGQFEAKHRQVALTWSPEDALRLTLWLLAQAGWELMEAEAVAKAPYERLAEKLHPFWGEKMGGGREAYTDRWVIAALSDLNGRFQARDLVRLIHFASGEAQSFPLAHRAIRTAVEECSVRKIGELEIEVEQFRPIFDQLRSLDREARTIPIPRSQLPLRDEEIGFLEEQGILFYEEREEQYYMPEIIRHGLDFGMARRGRARVLSLLRAATRKPQ